MNEDGEQNFIRVSHKTNQKGLGFQERDDQWTGHENAFNSLLKSFDDSTNENIDNQRNEDAISDFGDGKNKNSKSIKSKLSGKSLEEISKRSTVRVHYRKFTRGKDVSKYSEKDLANIFGKKCEANEEETLADKLKPITDPSEEKFECTNESKPRKNTQFIKNILDVLINTNHSGHASMTLEQSNHEQYETEQTVAIKKSPNIDMDEVFEINRYHAEMFRFVDLDGFPSANLSDLSGYGYSKQIELKISEKSKDQTKINDLWEYALIRKYGQDVTKAKKSKQYSMKHLKKKNLFRKL